MRGLLFSSSLSAIFRLHLKCSAIISAVYCRCLLCHCREETSFAMKIMTPTSQFTFSLSSATCMREFLSGFFANFLVQKGHGCRISSTRETDKTSVKLGITVEDDLMYQIQNSSQLQILV